MDEEILPEDDSIFSDIVNEDDSVCSNALLEDSYSSFLGDEAVCSTPQRKGRGRGRGGGSREKGSARGRRRGGSSSTATSNTAVNPYMCPPARLPCPQCKNSYANERTLAVHVKMHAMKDASSRAPDTAELRDITKQSFMNTLDEVQRSGDVGGLSASINDYCQSVQCAVQSGSGASLIEFLSETFHDILHSHNVLLPSSLRSAVYCKMNYQLSSIDFRKKLKEEFLTIQHCTAEIVNICVGILMLKLSNKVLANVLIHMRGSWGVDVDSRKKRSSDRVDGVEFLQLCYHVGGSVVSGFLHKGRTWSSSQKWSVYVNVLECKFLRQAALGNECSSSVSSFTAAKDRGGLKHLNQDSFEFFVFVLDKLMGLEGPDGSLPRDVVDQSVTQDSAVLCMWDELVGSDLTEEQSLDLLVQTVNICARIVSKGIMKRRLNEELKKSYSSVPLRYRLAR